MQMYTYMYMYIHIYVYVYAYIYIYICMYIYMYVYIYIYICVCVCVCVCVCACVCVCVCVQLTHVINSYRHSSSSFFSTLPISPVSLLFPFFPHNLTTQSTNQSKKLFYRRSNYCNNFSAFSCKSVYIFMCRFTFCNNRRNNLS